MNVKSVVNSKPLIDLKVSERPIFMTFSFLEAFFRSKLVDGDEYSFAQLKLAIHG